MSERARPDDIVAGIRPGLLRPVTPWCRGDVWTWTCIDADTKLIPCWYVGGRTATDAVEFMNDVASRMSNRVQLTTDGLNSYLIAVRRAFKGDIDYAMIQKLYGTDPKDDQRRYSPAKCIGIEEKVITENPDPNHFGLSPCPR